MFHATVTLVLLLFGVSAPVRTSVIKNRRIERNKTVAHVLYSVDVDDSTVHAVCGALRAAEFDFHAVRPGDQLRLVFRAGQLDVLNYRRNWMHEWQVRRVNEKYYGKKRALEREQRIDVVELDVVTSVWDAVIAAGEQPEIALALSDVFAWDIDFYRDVQVGDHMRAVIEKVFHKNRFMAYGHLLAAEYKGKYVGMKRTFHYQLPDGSKSYFMSDGTSARKTFLKSPLKYAFVTSRFGNRRHPILKYFRRHSGVDYRAPIGTLVWAVADGTVTRAHYTRAGGNVVCIKHVKGFESCYMHLSRMFVKAGQRIAQKDIIAKSGKTGRLITGPHLHYGLKRHGKWVNPFNQRFPRAAPLPKALLPDFQAHIADISRILDAKSMAFSKKQ